MRSVRALGFECQQDLLAIRDVETLVSDQVKRNANDPAQGNRFTGVGLSSTKHRYTSARTGEGADGHMGEHYDRQRTYDDAKSLLNTTEDGVTEVTQFKGRWTGACKAGKQ